MAANCAYNGVSLGDYSWMIPSVSMPDTAVHIPRAHGIRQRDMGGGEMILTVKSWVVKSSIATLAVYLESIVRSFGTGLASLVIDGTTYTNCKLLSIQPEDRYNDRVDYFTCTFKKSAMKK